MTHLAGGITRTTVAFVAGLVVGALALGVGAQGNRIEGNLGVNHVGIGVEDLSEAITYYTQTLGFREAAVLRDEAGEPTLAFIQVSRNTFIELGPASDTRPAGINHFGIEVEDAEAAVADLRRRGVEIEDARAGRTVSRITSTVVAGGVRMELHELQPDSMVGEAIASWR